MSQSSMPPRTPNTYWSDEETEPLLLEITYATALFVNDEGWQSLSLSMISMLIGGDARLGVNTRQHMEQHLVGADPSDSGISNQFS